jgi:hypothetical protein
MNWGDPAPPGMVATPYGLMSDAQYAQWYAENVGAPAAPSGQAPMGDPAAAAASHAPGLATQPSNVSNSMDESAFKVQSADFEPLHDDVIDRRFVVRFHGSMQDFQKSVDNTFWRPVEQSIFQSRTRGNRNNVGAIAEEPEGNLDEVMLHSVEMESYSNTAPISLGLKFSEKSMYPARGNYRFPNGSRVSAFLHANSTCNETRVIAKDSPWARSEYLSFYEGYTPDQLRGKGVVKPVKTSDRVYVQLAHPVVEELSMNDDSFKEELSRRVEEQSLTVMNNQYWVEMPEKMFQEGTKMVERQLKERLPLVNLKNMSIELVRPGSDWDDPIEGAVDSFGDDGDVNRELYTTPFCIEAVIRMRYSFP